MVRVEFCGKCVVFGAPSAPMSMEDRTSTRITRVIEHMFKFSPHIHQLKALQSLLDKKQDTILYAPTNAGKSLIAQAYPYFAPVGYYVQSLLLDLERSRLISLSL